MTDSNVMNYQVLAPNGDEMHLTYHAGVGVGDCQWMTVGCNTMFRHMLAGEAMHQSAILCDLSDQGQFAVSQAAYQLLEDRCTVAKSVTSEEVTGWIVEAFIIPAELARRSRKRLQPPKSPRVSSPMPDGSQDDLDFLNDVDDGPDGAMRPVPSMLMPPRAGARRLRMDRKMSTVMGPTSFNSKAMSFMFDVIHRSQAECQGQIRTVNTLFIKLRPEARSLSHSEVADLHQVFNVLFGELGRLDGVCNKVVVDDKGLVALCVFGLPFHSNEDDTVRALEFAWMAAERVERVTGRIGVGITRQKVFCGNVGGDQRKEYTVLGNGVNLAARLMSLAAESKKLQSTILCSQEVYREVRNSGKFVFDEPQKHQLKGLAQPIKVYPIAKAQLDSNSASTARRSRGSSVTSSMVHVRNARYQRQASEDAASHRSSVTSLHSARREMPSIQALESLPFSLSLSEEEVLVSPVLEAPHDGGLSIHRASSSKEGDLKPLVGRTNEMSAIKRIMEAVAGPEKPMMTPQGKSRAFRQVSNSFRRERARARLLIIYGDAGAGKSLLLAHAAHLATTSMQMDWVFTSGDIREIGTPLYSLKLLLADVMSIYAAREQEWVSKVPTQYRMWLPWLHAVAPESVPQRLISNCGFLSAPPETAASLPSLFKFAQDLLAVRFSNTGGLLILVDDAQWVDNATFEFLSDLMTTNPNIAMVMGMRYNQTKSSSARRYSTSSTGSNSSVVRKASSAWAFKASKESFFENEHLTRVTMKQQIHLDSLSAWESTQHMCAFLRVSSMDPALAALVHRSSDGNPGFAEQFIRRLQEKDAIGSDGYEAYLKSSYTSDKIELPSGVESLVVSRLDTLGTKQSSLLKMACVIGPAFTVPLLADCLGDQVAECLVRVEELISSNLLVVITDEDASERPVDNWKPIQYTFKRSVFAMVLYDSMLFSERKQRHEKVLSVLEEASVKDYALLAHHCNALGLPKGMDYFIAAAEHAWEAKDLPLCIKMATGAQTFQAQHRSKVGPAMPARWEFLLAACKYRAGDLQGAIQHVEKCLPLLGFSLPKALQRVSLFKQHLVHLLACCARPAAALDGAVTPTGTADMHCELMAMRAERCLEGLDAEGLQLAALTTLNLSRGQSIPLQALARSVAALAKLVLESASEARKHYRKAKGLLAIGKHPIKTHQLVAWFHLLNRDCEALAASLKEAERQESGKDAVGQHGMNVVAVLEKALRGDLTEALKDCEEALRLAREAQSPYCRELSVLRSLLLVYWISDSTALDEQCRMLASLRKRMRPMSPTTPAKTARRETAGAEVTRSAVLDSLIPALLCYAAGRQRTSDAAAQAIALVAEPAFAQCDAVPNLYHALALSMLLDVILCASQGAFTVVGYRDAVEAGLRSLKKAADFLPAARPLHLLWAGRWQQAQGQAAAGAATLRGAALHAEQLKMPYYTLTATYLRKAAEEVALPNPQLRELQRGFEALGAMHRVQLVGELLAK
eukprot:EG_transcript_259